MKVCVLIGFSYHESHDDTTGLEGRIALPGILIDLYQAYSFSKKMNPDKIIVISDIVEDQKTSYLANSLMDSTVDVGVFEFVKTISSLGEHYPFIDRDDFVELMESTLSLADETFIYYTGHVIEECIIFPIGNHLINANDSKNYHLDGIIDLYNETYESPLKMNLDEFRSIILSSIGNRCEVFIVMDCCGSNGLNLPFILKNGVGRLANEIGYIFIEPKVICVSSTKYDEDSIASKDGSVFSRSLFSSMKKRERSLRSLMNIIYKDCFSIFPQTATVKLSHPNLKFLWPWLFGSHNIKIDIDNINNVIIVNKKIHSNEHTYIVHEPNICMIE